ncbi:MAG: hypothetical protein ACRDJI_05440, partial [Actinomycetota bacterium]
INLAGVLKVMELEREIERLRVRHGKAVRAIEEMEAHLNELMDARERMALVPFKDVRRIRRAMKSDEIDRASQRRTFPSPPAT